MIHKEKKEYRYNGDLKKITRYYPNGNKDYEIHYLNGKVHNPNEPAKVFYYNDEQNRVALNCYYLDGNSVSLDKIKMDFSNKSKYVDINYLIYIFSIISACIIIYLNKYVK